MPHCRRNASLLEDAEPPHSLAAVRLFSQFKRWNAKLPPPNDPVIKHAWNATPNHVMVRRESNLLQEISSDEGSGSDTMSISTVTATPTEAGDVGLVQFLEKSEDDPKVQLKQPRLLLNPTALPFQPASLLPQPLPQPRSPSPLPSRALPQPTLAAYKPALTGPSPPPSPTWVSEILDSDGERKFRYYRQMLHTEVGVSTCLRALLSTGVQDAASAHPTAHLAHRLTANRIDDLRERIRIEALGMFASYWQELFVETSFGLPTDGTWRQEVTPLSPYIHSRGVNIAGFMGSLYRVGILGSNDVHWCIDTLLFIGVVFLPFMAAQVLFEQAGDRICEGHSGLRAEKLKARIRVRGHHGRFVWGPTETQHTLVLLLLETIDRYFGARTMRRILAAVPCTIVPGDTPRNSPTRNASSSPIPWHHDPKSN
ncbi:hypothetical protein B0H11DRAFT_2183485 [Mycena galericulata]|nr:hypothetical protein B0H11DRAFT_2183485 [Mycena galericulata]